LSAGAVKLDRDPQPLHVRDSMPSIQASLFEIPATKVSGSCRPLETLTAADCPGLPWPAMRTFLEVLAIAVTTSAAFWTLCRDRPQGDATRPLCQPACNAERVTEAVTICPVSTR
jgi:hypothetical protein